ncbi:BSD domain-containing protein 1 [Dissophora globulifera]|uniref:BSD domain-containing protein 1 n=1 Tax=Dissophora globulifera TaxID=979702 RepID=A0A9P6RFP9_9FUNG|nr:BSD domain-containing protein 1 [Dissophora globulifera]
MDDFYQFMSPLEGATNNANDRPSTRPDSAADPAASSPTEESAAESSASASTAPTPTSSRASWSAWGVSFNKLIERGKKDMNEFVDVTRKDLTELVHTVQQERSTALETLTKKVEDLKTTLPPLPASVNTASADIFGRVSTVVGGIKQEITEAATGVSSNAATTSTTTTDASVNVDSGADASASSPEGSEEHKDVADEATPTDPAAAHATSTSSSSLMFASTASLLTAGATSLTQTLSSSTKEISTTANELFKKKLPAAAEKHLGEADQFLKSTTETLKTNGLLAEQYVNKFGAGMANFLNSAVVISAPEEKEITASRSKKMVFDRKAAILEKLRMDPATYIVDPMTTIADNDIVGLERYKYFLQSFNIPEYQQRNARMLNEYPEVKALMNKLIPGDVADEELFWQRYYFRLYEIEEEEKRRKKLVQGKKTYINRFMTRLVIMETAVADKTEPLNALEAGAELAEEDFTWDDNEDEDEDEETSGGQGSVTPKADKKSSDTVTPRASQILSSSKPGVKREPLTPEALASSLAALPIPDGSTAGSEDDAVKVTADIDDEWGSESLKSPTSLSAQSFSAKSSTGAHSKSPTTNMSSTRTSEDAYEVVDGVETPLRVPVASITSVSSAASSPALDQPARQQSSKKSAKEEDDWSDWE